MDCANEVGSGYCLAPLEALSAFCDLKGLFSPAKCWCGVFLRRGIEKCIRRQSLNNYWNGTAVVYRSNHATGTQLVLLPLDPGLRSQRRPLSQVFQNATATGAHIDLLAAR